MAPASRLAATGMALGLASTFVVPSTPGSKPVGTVGALRGTAVETNPTAKSTHLAALAAASVSLAAVGAGVRRTGTKGFRKLRASEIKHGRLAMMASSGLVAEEKASLVARLLAAKEQSGKTFDEIALGLGLTNAYTANLFFNQAQLTPTAAAKIKELVPGINDEDLKAMQKPPMRSFDPAILQEPNVYRTYEAIMHYGEAIKALVNEQCGDGIMSAIDFYLDVGTTVGKKGEKRVVITMNGKFLPHLEQIAADNTVPGPRD